LCLKIKPFKQSADELYEQVCVGGRMLLQGDLQKVFDALYHLGVIDPVLEKDWSQEFKKIEQDPHHLSEIVGVVNSNVGSYQDLMNQLCTFNQEDLGHLAMVVAKELVGFHTNKVVH
jgi:hypothetical protein